MNVESIISVLRWKPFDTSTPAGRSMERYRRIAFTALSSGGVKSINILTSLISVPLTIGYLGTERYGLWMTISSFVAMLSFADLGLGNGLLNAISEANGKDDRYMASEYVSNAFFMLSGISFFLALVFVIIYPFITWQKIFNVSSVQAVSETGPALIVLITCFLVNIPLGIINRIQMGYQEGFQNNLWQAGGNLLSLGFILIAIHLEKGLPWLVLAMTGAPVVTSLFNGIFLFGFQRPWLRPNIRYLKLKTSKKIYNIGILFFVLQIAVAIAFSSDNIVTSHILGLDAVSCYSVTMRLFMFIPMIIFMILNPMWSSYGESIARGDMDWVRKSLIRTLKMSFFISVIPGIFLIFMGNDIIHIWVGYEIKPPFMLLMGLGIWAILSSMGNAVAMFLNGANVVRFQVICASLMCITSILGKIFLAKTIGIAGIIWATVIAYTLFTVIPCLYMIPKLLFRLNAGKKKENNE